MYESENDVDEDRERLGKNVVREKERVKKGKNERA